MCSTYCAGALDELGLYGKMYYFSPSDSFSINTRIKKSTMSMQENQHSVEYFQVSHCESRLYFGHHARKCPFRHFLISEKHV